MAKQQQSQWKAPQLSPEQQEAMVKLGQHMGHGMDEFDMEVGDEIERLVHERNYKKMKAAQSGQELGPSQFLQQQEQQAGALQRQAATQGASQASQAQAGMTTPNAPPAPSGPAGVSQPFPAQAKPGAVPTTGKAPSGGTGEPSEGEAPEEPE